MKKETKTTKKIKYIVDLTGAETPEDVKYEFIKTKALNGVKITEDEFKFIVRYGADLAFEVIDACVDTYVKSSNYTKIEDDKLAQEMLELINKTLHPKKPWYKRFWGWVTKPFKKNK